MYNNQRMQDRDENNYDTRRLGAIAAVADDVILALLLVGGGFASYALKNTYNRLKKSGGMFNKRYSSRMKSFGKKGAVSILLAASVMVGTAKNVLAENRVPISKNVSIVEKSTQLRRLTNYIAVKTEKTPQTIRNTSDLLYETAVHESMRLKKGRQIIRGGKFGIARSIFMVEPETASNLVRWARNKPKAMSLLTTTSGKTAKDLLLMSRQDLANMLMENDTFAASMARVKYLSAPGKIPSTREARAAYWSKWYQGKNNPVKELQYLRDNRLISEEIKASQLAKAMKKHTMPPPKTHGLVNDVLHNRKVMHKVASQNKKMSGVFNLIRR